MLKTVLLNRVSVYVELVCYFKYIDYISNIYTKLASNLTIMFCRLLLLRLLNSWYTYSTNLLSLAY